jgi:hypothetical protein
MGHFGGEEPSAILGDVGSTAPSIKRSYVSGERVNFGQLVQIDQTKPLDTNIAILAVGATVPMLGVALYSPVHPDGYYSSGSNMSILTEGDVKVKVNIGDTFRAGDLVYVDSVAAAAGDSAFIFTATPTVGEYVYGVFVEGGTATADNFFTINYKPNHTTL